jgi:lipopolysaccharide transport system permease protein
VQELETRRPAATPERVEPPREKPVTRISADGPALRFRELIEFRELLYYLVRRDLIVRYVQTVLGFGWAVLQPLVTMVIFTIFFGQLASVDSQGAPYALFSLAALVPWTYFSNGINLASGSVVAQSGLLTKVYFPRLFIPLSPLLAAFVDFVIAFAVLMGVLLATGHFPEPEIAALPVLVLIMLAATAGLGLLLAALASRYRDVRYAAPFLIQLLLFVSPVIYSASVVPTPERYLYALNPMVGVIEGFRAALLDTGAFPWTLVGIGAASALVLLAAGVAVYTRTARYFADLA